MRALWFSLILLVPTAVHATEVRGRVVRTDEATWLQTEAGRVALLESHATDQVQAFAGTALEVVLEGEVEAGALRPRQLVSPVRAELAGKLVHAEQGWRMSSADASHPVLNQAHPLLPAAEGESVLFDVWRFTAGVWVVAIQGTTTEDWTLLRVAPRRMSLPSGYVRSRRTVWILDVQGDYSRVRDGDTEGWASSDTLRRLPPPQPGPHIEEPAPRAGLSDLVPIPEPE